MPNFQNIVEVIGVIVGLVAAIHCLGLAIGVIGGVFMLAESIASRRGLYPDLGSLEFWWNYSEPMPWKFITYFGVMSCILGAIFLWIGPPEFTAVYKNYLSVAWSATVSAIWAITPYVLIALMPLIITVYGVMAIFKIGLCSPRYRGGPLNLESFNTRFILANEALRRGDTDGLKEGIRHLIDSMEVAGDFAQDIASAIRFLRCALTHHDRADTKGPWNRDLSGYGLGSWRNDLYDRDTALRHAWPHIQTVNDLLREQNLGWNY